MSDFTVNAQCPVCKLRFPMDDGIPCDCLTPNPEQEEEETESWEIEQTSE